MSNDSEVSNPLLKAVPVEDGYIDPLMTDEEVIESSPRLSRQRENADARQIQARGGFDAEALFGPPSYAGFGD